MAKKGKKYALRDIRTVLRKKNYGQAYQLFSSVRIKKGQEKEAESLKHTMLCGLSLKAFQNREFEKCIRFATTSLPTPSDHLQLFAGLSHLFLTQYDTAAQLLQPVVEKIPFTNFRFYYFLCLIYQNKEKISIEDSHLPAARKQFLSVAKMLQQRNYKKAADLLDQLKPESNSEFQNKNLLLNILQNDSSSLKENPKLRPLYRAMASMVLSKNEIAYLSSFSELTQQYDLSSTPQKKINPSEIIDDVRQLCNEGKPLSQEALKKCLLAPTEILPTLLFNHITVQFQKDREAHLDEIFNLIRKEYEHLCKVPEFIFLLVEIIKVSEEIPLPLDAIVKQYTSYFKETWTVEKAAQVSVQFSNILHEINPEAAADKKISLLGQQYLSHPDLVTLSWDCLALYCSSPLPSFIKWNYLNLFTRELEPVAKAYIRNDLAGLLNMIQLTTMNSSMPLGFLDDDFGMQPIGQKIKKQTLKMFEEILDHQPPLASDNFPLELLLIVGKQLEFKNKNLNQFQSIWNKYVQYFNESADSSLQKEYKELITHQQLANIDYKFFFKSKKNFTQAQKEGIDLTKVLSIEASRLIKEIDDTHFDENVLFHFGILLTNSAKAVKYGLAQEKVIAVFEKFMQQYVKTCEYSDCEHPVDFFYDLIHKILSRKALTSFHLLVAEACLKGGEEFIFEESPEDFHIDILVDYVETCLKMTSADASIPIDPIFSKKLSGLLDTFN